MYQWLRAQLTPTRIAHAYFDGEGTGGAAPAGDGGAAPPAAPAGGEGDPPKDPTQDPTQPGPVPYARFQEVNRKAQELEARERERSEADLKAKGEHEQIATKAKTERDQAVATMQTALRRSAFAEAAAGKVADVKAAATLAAAEGLLVQLRVDAEGNVEGDAGKIVSELIKAYPFLAADTKPKGTGSPLGGAGANPVDPSKLSSDEKLRQGIDAELAKLPEHRRGAWVGGSGGR